MKSREWAGTVAAILSGALLLTGCGDSAASSSSGGNESPSELVVAIGAQSFESLDPQMSASPPTDSVTRLVYEGLLAPGDAGSVKPLLATEWSNPEPTVWEFTIRDGVTFHDGAKLDAAAVATSFTHILDPAANKTRSSEFSRVAKVSAAGPMSVRFDLKQPWPTLPNQLAYSAAMIVSPQAVASGVDLASQGAGTGPYQLKELKDGSAVLTANTSYWGGEPAVGQLTMTPVPAENTRVQMLKSGQADIATALPISSVSGLESSPDTQVVSSPGGLVMHIGFNFNYGPLGDDRVRRALNLAVDRDAIVKTTLGGYGEKADSYLPPTVAGFTKAAEPYPYDPDQAKALLADAGYGNGFDLTLTTPSGRYPMAAETAQAVQGYLEKVGVRVKIETIDFGAEIDALMKPKAENTLQAYLLGWQSATGEPSLVSNIVFRSTALPPEGWNTMFYANTSVDKLFEQADVEADETKRNELYAQAQQQVYNDAPWLFLNVPDNLIGAKKGIEGIATLPDGTLMLQNVS